MTAYTPVEPDGAGGWQVRRGQVAAPLRPGRAAAASTSTAPACGCAAHPGGLPATSATPPRCPAAGRSVGAVDPVPPCAPGGALLPQHESLAGGAGRCQPPADAARRQAQGRRRRRQRIVRARGPPRCMLCLARQRNGQCARHRDASFDGQTRCRCRGPRPYSRRGLSMTR